jgi:hypothetical protein
MWNILKKYLAQYNTTDVPFYVSTKEYPNLGRWVQEQRSAYHYEMQRAAGNVPITAPQRICWRNVKELEALGFDWKLQQPITSSKPTTARHFPTSIKQSSQIGNVHNFNRKFNRHTQTCGICAGVVFQNSDDTVDPLLISLLKCRCCGVVVHRACCMSAHSRETTKWKKRYEVHDNIQCRYKGGDNYWDGAISKVNADGTYNISYNDGDDELNVAEDLIRSSKPIDWICEWCQHQQQQQSTDSCVNLDRTCALCQRKQHVVVQHSFSKSKKQSKVKSIIPMLNSCQYAPSLSWQRLTAASSAPTKVLWVHSICAIYAAYLKPLHLKASGSTFTFGSNIISEVLQHLQHDNVTNSKKTSVEQRSCCLCSSKAHSAVLESKTGLLVQCCHMMKENIGGNIILKRCQKWFHPSCAIEHRLYLIHGDITRAPRIYCHEHAPDRLYCRCKQPYWKQNQDDMIECVMCRTWLHNQCLNAAEKSRSNEKNFLCSDCHEAQKKGKIRPSNIAVSEEVDRMPLRQESILLFNTMRNCANEVSKVASSLVHLSRSRNVVVSDAEKLQHVSFVAPFLACHKQPCSSGKANMISAQFETIMSSIMLQIRDHPFSRKEIVQDKCAYHVSQLLMTDPIHQSENTLSSSIIDRCRRFLYSGCKRQPFWEFVFIFQVAKVGLEASKSILSKRTKKNESCRPCIKFRISKSPQ